MQPLLEILFLGGATAFSYVLWDIAMRKGKLVFVAAFSYFIPLLSTLLILAMVQVSIDNEHLYAIGGDFP